MYLVKKCFFKLMELGLGLKPCFLLSTVNPIFVNFKLSSEEATQVKSALPSGFTLDAIQFTDQDPEPAYWVSYNLYEVMYPKKELAHLRKVRCEINTFVSDALGRKGILVFSGSPFVSKEERRDPISLIADLAERLVMWIYGVGKLLSFEYRLTDGLLSVHLKGEQHSLNFDLTTENSSKAVRLAIDYFRYNDISFFNKGKTYDLVNSNSQFSLAVFDSISPDKLATLNIRSPFFDRAPDALYYYRGEISYLVSALNRSPRESFA